LQQDHPAEPSEDVAEAGARPEDESFDLDVDTYEDVRPYDPDVVYGFERDDDPFVDEESDDEADEEEDDEVEDDEGGDERRRRPGIFEDLDMEFDDIDDENRPQ
jgi:hypothetical protein